MRKRRAFSLVETVVVIVALGVAVPPTVMWLDQATDQRTDALMAGRAVTMAGAVMETVLADVASDARGMGFAALAAPATYLDAPTTGLRARLAAPITMYTNAGMTYDVSVGPLSDRNGSTTGPAADRLFRTVTVTVRFPTSRGETQVSMAAMVTEL